MKEELLEKIKAEKEILDTMPVNNEKNIKIYNERIDFLKQEYTEKREALLKEIKTRFNKKTEKEVNNEIENLKNQIENYSEIMEIIDEIKSPYQKSGLNKEIYRLSKYYKENLENVNNQIFVCVNIFRNLGIEISAEDFNISDYAKEYMEEFFSEMKLGDINSEIIKDKFEKLYWKCPDIIAHIEVILRIIYRNNIDLINKFYEKKKENIIEKYKIDKQNIIEQAEIARKDLINREEINRDNIINKFLTGKLNERDYTKEKVKSYYTKILNSETYKEIEENEEKFTEIAEDTVKFLNSVYEYKKFMEYKYILDEVNNIIKNKEKYKNINKESIKNIKEEEAKLKKLNKPSVFGKKEKNYQEIDEKIMDLKTKYQDLTKNILYEKIVDNLTDTSTIYDALKIASCFYEFLVECIIKHDNEIEQKDIDITINEFQEFLKFPYFTIINNISFNQEKDIALIIKDRYKLLNFNITKDDLSEINIDSLLNVLEKIRNNYSIKKVGLNIEEISNICKFNKILNENS